MDTALIQSVDKIGKVSENTKCKKIRNKSHRVIPKRLSLTIVFLIVALGNKATSEDYSGLNKGNSLDQIRR